MRRLICLVAAAGLLACNNEPSDANLTPDNSTPDNAQNIAVNAVNAETPPMMLPVELQQSLEQNCNGCHYAGGIGPFDFTDQETVVGVGELIAQVVESRQMPPWNMDPACADLKGDLRLTDDQIAVFSDWVDGGKPLVPEAPFDHLEAKNPEIGDPPAETDEVIDAMIPEAYNPVFGRSQDYLEDDFRCFVVDPGFVEDREMTGFEVLVDNVELSHHMVVFTADGDEENRNALAALEAEDAEPGFSCFGVSGFNVDSIAAVWAPGGARVGFPQRQGIGQTAVEVPAKSLIVIQMHYNKPAVDAGTDQSGVRMWFRPAGEPVHELAQATWAFVGNQPFRVPAGVDGTAVPDEECDVVYDTFTLDGDDENPVSPPTVGYASGEVECGIKQEDCEAEFGSGAEQCAIDYTSRLRVNSADVGANYRVVVAGTEVIYDAAAEGASNTTEVIEGVIAAINADPTLAGMVVATGNDRNNDGEVDEILVSNVDDATEVRIDEFTATGDAAVWRGYVDRCAQWEPQRLVEARGVGSSGCVQTEIYYRNPAPLKAWAAFSHMHLVGQRIETEVMRSMDDGVASTPLEADSTCAARTDAWDFDWQRTYWYEEPHDIPKNGLIRLRCRFDNSTSDTEVRLGDGSGSEMCLALFYLTL